MHNIFYDDNPENNLKIKTRLCLQLGNFTFLVKKYFITKLIKKQSYEGSKNVSAIAKYRFNPLNTL